MATLPRSPGVYKATCRSTTKVYIGSSVDVQKRVGEHIRALRRGKHANAYLQRAWDRYGEAVFEWELLEGTTIDDRLTVEQYYLDHYRAYEPDYGYNIAREAGSIRDLPRTPTWSQRISEALKVRFSNPANHPNTGRRLSAETRQKISKAHRGKQVSEETRRRFSEARRGKPGHSPTEEQRQRISESGRAYRREHPRPKWDAPMPEKHRRAIGRGNAQVFYLVTHPARGAFFLRNLRDFARRCGLHEMALHRISRTGGTYKEYRARHAIDEEIAAYLPYLGDDDYIRLE